MLFQHKILPRLNITSNKALIVKQDILDMSRKTNPVLDDLNIYLVIDSKKAENKFEDIDDPQKWSYFTI